MSRNLPNGIAETLGDTLVTSSPLFTTGDIHYLDNSSADAADTLSNGISKSKPFETLAYAISQASDGDIIVVLGGHSEALIAEVDITVAVVVAGAGETDGAPEASFSNYSATGYCIRLSAAGSELRNLRFAQHPSSAAIPQVNVAATGCRIIGCHFEAGEHNNVSSLSLDAALITYVKNCTFESVATEADDLPQSGLTMSTGTLFLENCVFDDNDFGYSTPALRATGAATIRAEGNSFLNGASASMVEASAELIIAGGTTSGGVQLVEA